MKRVTVFGLLVLLVTGLLLVATSDASISIADTSIPDEVASSVTEASNSSASATITITWTTVGLPDE